MKYISSNKIFNKYKKLVFILILFALFFVFDNAKALDYTQMYTASSINKKMVNLAGKANNIEKFKHSETAPEAPQNFVSDNRIHISGSKYPIYMWYVSSEKTIYWWTEDEHPYLAGDSSKLFYNLQKLKEIDISQFDTSMTYNMADMFYRCYELTSVDISNFDTSNVTDMSNMFAGTALSSLDISHFNTSNVTTMNNMFGGMINLKSENFIFEGIDTSNVTDMSGMFSGLTLSTLDLSSLNTSKVTSMKSMFSSSKIDSIIWGDNFDTSNVTDMSRMFYNWKNPSVDVSSFDTSNVTNMSYMFTEAKIESLDLSNFDTSNVTNMQNMFSCSSNGALSELNISSFNTSNVTDMSSMFSYCRNLTSLDLSNFDTSNVTTMGGMFYHTENIESLDLSNFDTSKVTSMTNMFNSMKKLKTLDLSNFITDNVTNMNGMFSTCENLESLNISSFNTYNVTDMSYMFEHCPTLTDLDLRSFDTTNVKQTYRMFLYDTGLTTLDLSSFTYPNLTYSAQMFEGCSNLETIFVNQFFDLSNVTTSTSMFSGCTSLVGAQGTIYDKNKVDKTYAIVDDVDNGNPGYLNYKEYIPRIFYPNGDIVEVALGSTFTFPEAYSKPDLILSTVTFDYRDGITPNTSSNVLRQYTFNNWKVNNDTYEPGDTKTVMYDIHLRDTYVETLIPIEFPEDPVVPGNTFLGWYNMPEGGMEYNYYLHYYSLTLYAHWKYENRIISFEENGGTKINDTAIAYGSAIGELPTSTRDGYILDGWYLDEEFTRKASSNTVVNDNIVLYAKWFAKTDFEYDYTNNEEVFIAPETGYYKLETWGAQGGNYKNVGGYGAYSVGIVQLNKNDKLYINVGGQPEANSTQGGYNGGGNGGDYGGQKGSGGGGATHISTKTGLLSTHSNDLNSLVIVSGGGSGGGYYDGWTDGTGSGGGIKGNDGYDFHNNSTEMFIGTGGTQTSGGICVVDSNYSDSKGSFGKGGNNYHVAPEEYGGPGGGAGFYGGGGSNRQHASAGGGSSYIGNSTLVSNTDTTKHMTCYNCQTSDVESTKTISNTCHSNAATADCAKEGAGYAKITYIPENHTVTYPDGSVEIYPHNTIINLGHTASKATDKDVVVTFMNHNDTEDILSISDVSYTPNGFDIGDIHYDDESTLLVDSDKVINNSYISNSNFEFPENPEKRGYRFDGWYTEEEGGEKVETLDGITANTTLHAHYRELVGANLIEGSTINGKFDKTNTTEFRRATLEEYNAANLTSDNIISTNDSPNVVYMWNTTIDSKVVTLYYTEADFMYMNADSSHMFQGLSNITELDLSDFITSNVTNMEYMFGYIGVTTLDLSTFDTSNVTKMNEMFFNSANLQELNVSSFDVSNVTTMVGMFDNCPSLQELDLSSFDTRKVKLMGSMFAYCSKLTTIYVSNKWSTSGLNQNANQSTMFAGDGRIMGYLGSKYDHYWHGDEKARIDGGPSNEGYLTDISHKGETHTVTFPDNSVKTYNHNSIVYLDTNETSLGEHTSGEITFKYHNGNIDTTSNQVFEMAGDGFTCDDKHYKDNGEIRVNSDKVIEYAYNPVITNSVFPEDPVKDGYIFMGWFTEEEGGEKYTEYTGNEPIVLHAQYGLPISYLMSGSDINNKINYLSDDSSINEFRRGTIEEYNQAKDSFDDNYNIISTDESPLPTYIWYDGENVLYYSDAENIYMNADSASMFSYTYASSIDVTEFDTSNVTDMSYMFSSGEMTELDLSHFNTNNVTNMSGMFQGCSSLQTIYVSNNWSTESLEAGNGEYMFSNDGNLVGSSGTTYDENHTDEEYARPDEGVSNPGYFTLVTFYNVTYPNSSTRSYKDGTVINLGENDSAAIIETAGTITFKYHDDKTEDTTLTKITTKTPNGFVVNGNHIDDNEDVTINEDKVIEYDYDESVVDNIFPVASKEGYEFIGWYTEETGGEKIEEYNGNEPITLHARYMTEFSKLKAGDEIQSKIFWSASGSFRKATLEEYNSVKDTLTDNDIISIEGTKPTYLWQTGENVLYYSEAETIYMNEDASSIFDSKSLSSIDLSGIDFSMTTNMNSIFRASDTATITLGNINTSNVTNMGSMFGQMSRLTSIDNLSFDTHNVTDMSYMFYDSHLLTELDLSDFDTSSVENMEYMFAGCNSLTSLNISSFETSQVTTMYSMFKYDSALTEINVSDFVTSNVESFSSMFEGCTSLSSIDVTNFDTQNANSLDGMFKDCSLLTTLDLSSFDTQNVMSISEMFSGDTSLETIYVSDAWSTNIIADWGRYDVFSYDENLVGGAGTVFDEEHTNYEYARIDGGVDNPGYLTLKVDQILPTDIELDTDNVLLMPGETHQIGVTFTPEGSGDTLTYSNYDDTKISVVDGLITGLSEGTTTITVGTENTDIEKTISITVLSDKLESTNYTVTDKVRPKENEEDPDITDRIIIGAEPGTLISDFKSNLDNPSEYIKIYDGDTELSEDDIVKTGLTIKLEINGIVHDEATIIIRGDINQDGLVNLMDKSVLSEQLLRLSDIEGYGVYAADIDNNDSINLMDKSKLSEYLLRLIDTLNE